MNHFPKIGAAILIVAAATLSLMGTPAKLSPVDVSEDIADIVVMGEDRVSAIELADWLVAEQPDVRVVDIRTPEDFAQVNIEGSMNIPFRTLLTRDGMSMLNKRDRIVLVCGDGGNAGKAWVVMRSKGYEAYTLDGGLAAWVDQILTPPDQQKNPQINSNQELAAKVNALREHYLGGGVGTIETKPMDMDSAPAPAPIPTAPKRKKKVAGGC